MIGLIYDHTLHKSKFSLSKLLIKPQYLTKKNPNAQHWGLII
ncbi:hypothetical protein M917_0902 [Psychrobacter aquaticus CMS 56]|uniref:Uncharacterized protein n=1 Tax=Psychrobacter aquaticus CMS 56 TaxID=1354303 RepID=U4TBW7_9GAMM|nr:hypothetical protein M917_0902 [Psychrobacter aquaticus CMS 56]